MFLREEPKRDTLLFVAGKLDSQVCLIPVGLGRVLLQTRDFPGVSVRSCVIDKMPANQDETAAWKHRKIADIYRDLASDCWENGGNETVLIQCVTLKLEQD